MHCGSGETHPAQLRNSFTEHSADTVWLVHLSGKLLIEKQDKITTGKKKLFSLLPELHGSVSDSHHGSFLRGSNGCQGSQQRGEVQVKEFDLILFRKSGFYFFTFHFNLFRCGVALDAWMFPLEDETFPRVKQPVFFINSEKFQWAENIRRMRKLDSPVTQRKMITIRYHRYDQHWFVK